jgi:hypothetical protein
VFGVLSALAVLPFWLTRILPMQDYPQFLLFARAYADSHDPASPYAGTYATGFPLSPTVLPLLFVRALGVFGGLETGGRLLWTLYAVGLPAASLYLLRVLRKDRWAVLLVFPLLLSYWVVGGFFAFATAIPLVVLALSLAVRWLEAPTLARGVLFASAACAVDLWHALAFVQLLVDFAVLWLLARHAGARARLRTFAPVVPSVAMFVAWTARNAAGRPRRTQLTTWPRFFENATSFFDFVAPPVPRAGIVLAVLAAVLACSALALPSREPSADPFRVKNPFALLALLSAALFLVLPANAFGAEGIQNRQPWLACVMVVFAWPLPARPAARAALLALVGSVGALALVDMAVRFHAFARESAGASRLIDAMGSTDTLFLAPYGGPTTPSFPKGKPLVAIDLYAAIRHGVLPNASFAGYDVNFIRYVDNKNPMPGLGARWLRDPALARFDDVLVHGVLDPEDRRFDALRPVARDGGWSLYRVCGTKTLPDCALPPGAQAP